MKVWNRPVQRPALKQELATKQEAKGNEEYCSRKKQTGDRFECGLIEILDQVLPKKQQKLYSGLP